MKKSTCTVFWTLFLSAALFIPALAQDETLGGKPSPRDENRYEAAARRLNLNAEQREKIRDLRQNQREQMKKLHQSLQEAHKQLRKHLDNPEATRESIAPLAADVKDILVRMVDQRIESVLAVKEMLTPEQFNQLKRGWQKMREKGRAHRPEMRGFEEGRRPFEEGQPPFRLKDRGVRRSENIQEMENNIDE